VSGATRDELLRHNLFPPERITVIPMACIRPVPRRRIGLGSKSGGADAGCGYRHSLAAQCGKHAAAKNGWTFCSECSPRSGGASPEHGWCAWEGLRPEQIRLARELKVEDAILNLPFLERDLLAAVYKTRHLAVAHRRSGRIWPAPDRGHGLRLSGSGERCAGAPEVGGAAACYSPVADVDSWAGARGGLLNARTRDRAAWEIRREQGRVHAARYFVGGECAADRDRFIETSWKGR